MLIIIIMIIIGASAGACVCFAAQCHREAASGVLRSAAEACKDSCTARLDSAVAAKQQTISRMPVRHRDCPKGSRPDKWGGLAPHSCRWVGSPSSQEAAAMKPSGRA